MSTDNAPTLDDYAAAVQNVANQRAEDRSHLDGTLGQIIGQWGGAGEQIGSAIKAAVPWVKSAYRIAKVARSTSRALSTKDPQDIRNAKNDMWNASSELLSTAASSAAPKEQKSLAKKATKAAVSSARVAYETKGTPEYEDAQKQAARDVSEIYPDGNTTKTFLQAASGDRDALTKVASKFNPQVGKVLDTVNQAHDSAENLKNGVVDEYAKRYGQLQQLEAKSQGITQRLQEGSLTPADQALLQQHIQSHLDQLHSDASNYLAGRGYNVSPEFTKKLANGTLGLDDLHQLALRNTISRTHPDLLNAVDQINTAHSDYQKIVNGQVDQQLAQKYNLSQDIVNHLNNPNPDGGFRTAHAQALDAVHQQLVKQASDELAAKGYNVSPEFLEKARQGNITPDDVRQLVGIKDPESYIPSTESLRKSVSTGLRTLDNPHARILADALDAANGDEDAIDRFKGHLVDQLPSVHKAVAKSFFNTVDVVRKNTADVRQEAQRIANERAARDAAAVPSADAPSRAPPTYAEASRIPPVPPPPVSTQRPDNTAPPPPVQPPVPPPPPAPPVPDASSTQPETRQPEAEQRPVDVSRPTPIATEDKPGFFSRAYGRLSSFVSSQAPPESAPKPAPAPVQTVQEPSTISSTLKRWLTPSPKAPAKPFSINDDEEIEPVRSAPAPVHVSTPDDTTSFRFPQSEEAAKTSLDPKSPYGYMIKKAFQAYGVDLSTEGTELKDFSQLPESSSKARGANEVDLEEPETELQDFSTLPGAAKHSVDDDDVNGPPTKLPVVEGPSHPALTRAPPPEDRFEPPQTPAAQPLPPVVSAQDSRGTGPALSDEELLKARQNLKPAQQRFHQETTDGSFTLGRNDDGSRSMVQGMKALEGMTTPVIQAQNPGSSVQFGQTGTIGTTTATSSGDLAAGTTPTPYIPPVEPSKTTLIEQGAANLGVGGAPIAKDTIDVVKTKIANAEKAAQKKAAQEKAAQKKSAQEKAAQDKAAQKKAAQEKAAQDKAAQEKAAQDKAAQDKAAQDKAAQDKAEQDRLAQEAQDKAEQDRLAQEAQDKAEQDRLAQEAQDKAEQDRLAQEAQDKAEQDRLAQEAQDKAEQDRLAQEAQEAKGKQEQGDDPAADNEQTNAEEQIDIENAVEAQRLRDQQQAQLEEDGENADQGGQNGAASAGLQSQVNNGNPNNPLQDDEADDAEEDEDDGTNEGDPNQLRPNTEPELSSDEGTADSAISDITKTDTAVEDAKNAANDTTDIATGAADTADGNVLGAVLNFGMLGASTALTALGIVHTPTIHAPPPPVVAAQQVAQANSNDLFNPDADSVNAV